MGVIQNQIMKLHLSFKAFVETYKFGGYSF